MSDTEGRTLRTDGGQSTSGTDHVERVRELLKEIHHLQYVDVSKSPIEGADVRVQVADHMENALVNNGEFAQFHGDGYVGNHVDFEEQFIDLHSVNTGGESA